MKKKNIGIIILLLCAIGTIFSGCKNKAATHIISFSYSEFQKEKKLVGEKIFLHGLSDSRHMIIYKDFLVCEKMNDEHLISVHNLQTGEKDFEFLRKGVGPGELLCVSDLEINPVKNELLILDGITSKLNIYNLDMLLLKRKLDPKFSGKTSGNAYQEQLIKIGDTTYLGTGISSRFNFYNQDGIITKRIGNYELFDNKEKDIWLTQIYRGQLNYNYTTGEIAFLNKLTDIIEFYNKDSLTKVLDGPDHFDAIYKIVSIDGGFGLGHLNNKTRVAFDNSWSNEEYIFSLYSGKLWGDIGFHYSDILTFSWDGIPLDHFILDIPVFAISVDVKERIIYGLNVEMENPFIVKYKF